MSHDRDLERYFHDRSSTLDLPHADVGAIRTRARRHRRRQTAVRGGVAAALLAGGTLLVVDRGRSPEVEAQAAEGSGPGAAIASPLEWATVDVEAGRGLGGFSTSATAVSGDTMYALSTAPGPSDPVGPARLYRSTDGSEWEDAGAPEGLYPTSLAFADGSLYAVGTTAVGGEVAGVALARSADGGAGWTTDALPFDLATVEPGFPGTTKVSDVAVARSGATTVVTVAVRGAVDPALVMGDDPTAGGWYQEGDSLVSSPPCDTEVDPADGRVTSSEDGPVSTTVPAAGSASSPPPTTEGPAPAGVPSTAPSATDLPSSERPSAETPPAACQPERRSLAELGLTDSQVGLARGRTYVLVATDGGAFTSEAVLEGVGGSESELVVAEDGWWYVAPTFAGGEGVVAYRSVDGTTWTSTPLARDAYLIDAGLVDGRPVAVTSDLTGGVTSHRIGADGMTNAVDVRAALGLPGGTSAYATGVGPLGVAVVLPTRTDGTGDLVVAHSLDGTTFAAEPIPAPDPDLRRSVLAVGVTADAITVRMTVRTEAETVGNAPSRQQLFVGTPR